MRRLLLLFVFFRAALVSAAEDPNLKFFRDLAETRNFTLGRPVSPKISSDNKVIFLRSAPRDPTLRLYEFDLAAKTERELLTPEQLLRGAEEVLTVEEKARRERQRQSLKGFTAFELSKDGRRLLVTLSGKLYVVNRSGLKVTELPGAGWIDPRFSPDGNRVAAVRDRELYVIDFSTGSERAVTHGATETLSHGTAEFVAQEEMDRNEGYWWSPDSQMLLCQETDEAGVEVRYIADPLHPEAAPGKFFYPRAGTPNAIVRLSLVSLRGGAPLPVSWDAAQFPYLAHVSWSENAPLTILVQNREQTDQRLLAVDLATGRTRELLRETDRAWLNLDAAWSGVTTEKKMPVWLSDGKQFLWSTERRGSWQLELRDASGALVRELTPVTFRYRGLLGVDEAGGMIFVRGSNDPRQAHVWKFPLAGGDGALFESTSDEQSRARVKNDGLHTASFFAESRLLVHTADRWSGDYSCQVVSASTGQVVASLRSVAERLPRFPFTRLVRTQGERAFDAAVTLPSEFVQRIKSNGKKYPVILSVYAGPGVKRVTADLRSYFLDQWMADQGYVVVRIDGRGTPWHGREWERVIKGNFIDVALEDQIAGLRALAADFPTMDLSRVGVSGWSFGGYFAAMAAIRRPEVFAVGIVGAPVVTWENYDTHYTERYLGLPQHAPEAYRVSNVTTYASALERPLLLIHGLTDDNVYAQHTLQLCDALFMAGKPYEFIPMLGTHMVSDPLVRLRQQMRIMEFLARALESAERE